MVLDNRFDHERGAEGFELCLSTSSDLMVGRRAPPAHDAHRSKCQRRDADRRDGLTLGLEMADRTRKVVRIGVGIEARAFEPAGNGKCVKAIEIKVAKLRIWDHGHPEGRPQLRMKARANQFDGYEAVGIGPAHR